MSKVSILSQGLAATLLLTPVLGYGDNYLFPTNIVPQGKFDVQLTAGHTGYKQKIEISIVNFLLQAETHRELTQELVSMRYGLAADTHIGVATSYNQYKLRAKTLPESDFQLASNTEHQSSTGNLNLFAKHRFYNDSETPFSLSVAANLEANTANNHYTAVDLILSTGWKFSEGLRAYAIANTFLSDQDAIADRQAIDIGFYKQITPRITLVPKYIYSHFQQVKNGNVLIASPRDNQYLGLSAQIEVLPNTYLIPAVGYFNFDSYQTGVNNKMSDSFDEKSYSLTFYHLF
jgi:hypothetical protein